MKHEDCLFVVVLALVLCSRPVMAQEHELAKLIDPLVHPYLDQSLVVGMAVGVIRGDETLVRGYGQVMRGKPSPPDGQTVYEIGSLTKTFTGLLLAEAVTAGRLKLDQPVADLLPDGARITSHADGPILLKHLATHVSGLPRMPDNFSPRDARDPYADYGADKLYECISSHKPIRGPMKQSEYSNLAFGLLGQVLADRAGVIYGELVRSRIAEPLGMSDTAVELNNSLQARLAPPYNGELGEDHRWTFQAMAGAGAVCSTADDLVRYAKAYLNPPAGKLEDAIELAWTVHQPAQDGGFAMGLGWHVARDGSTRWHNGQTGGYHSMMLINRRSGVAVVVLANTATMEIDTLAEQLARALMGVQEQPREFAKTGEVAPEQMERLVGRYQLVPTFILTVKIEDGHLMVGATGQPFFRVFPQSDTKWSYRVVDASLTFELGDAGPAKAVTLHQNGLSQRAERLD